MCDVTHGPSVPGGPGFQAIKTPPSNAWAGNNPGLLTNVLVGSPELAPLSWSGKQLPPVPLPGPEISGTLFEKDRSPCFQLPRSSYRSEKNTAR